ncbi:hypothetical protein DIPPA_12268 [Diplonema papillatum]|nr:hypothetical protein DIPPA_12268 [Diplonema papillatum]
MRKAYAALRLLCVGVLWAGLARGEQFDVLRWKYACPYEYEYPNAQNSKQPQEECEQIAAFLGFPAGLNVSSDTPKRGCFVQGNVLYFNEPGSASPPQLDSDSVALCKRVALAAPQTCNCNCTGVDGQASASGTTGTASVVIGTLTLVYMIFVLPFVVVWFIKGDRHPNDMLGVPLKPRGRRGYHRASTEPGQGLHGSTTSSHASRADSASDVKADPTPRHSSGTVLGKPRSQTNATDVATPLTPFDDPTGAMYPSFTHQLLTPSPPPVTNHRTPSASSSYAPSHYADLPARYSKNKS